MPSSTLPYTISSTSLGQKISLIGNTNESVQIINEDSVNRIWVSSSDQVKGDGTNGISVEPLTQLVWEQGKDIWAILDQSATGPVNIKVTNDVTWQPSPIQVAAAIAAAGIVPRDRMTQIGVGVGNSAGSGTVMSTTDVSFYNSLVLRVQTVKTAAPTSADVIRFQIEWSVDTPATLILGVDYLYVPWASVVDTEVFSINARVPIRGPFARVTWTVLGSSANSTVAAYVYGSYKDCDVIRYNSSTSAAPGSLAAKANSAEGSNDMLYRMRRNMSANQVLSGWSFPGAGRHIFDFKSSVGAATVSLGYTDAVFGLTELENFQITTTQSRIELDLPNCPLWIVVTKDGTLGFINAALVRG